MEGRRSRSVACAGNAWLVRAVAAMRRSQVVTSGEGVGSRVCAGVRGVSGVRGVAARVPGELRALLLSDSYHESHEHADIIRSNAGAAPTAGDMGTGGGGGM